jgi:8-amino-7-oxononanoate synthase
VGAAVGAPPLPSGSLDEVLGGELQLLESAGLRRVLRPVQQRRGGTVLVQGERLGDFASNDYLALAADARLARAAWAVLQAEGVGVGATRLGAGHQPVHAALERALAQRTGTAQALLFPSGYLANAGAIPALVGPGDLVLCDALVHASLLDGCRLSRAAVALVPHGSLEALERMLHEQRARHRRALIVLEGLFAMDGDTPALDRVVALARAHDAWTYVDESHALGVLGPTGGGATEQWGVQGAVDVVAGTLGKALGTAGGFVAGSTTLVEYLTSTARTFVFTTATPPALAAAALEALRLAQVEGWRRDAVRARARQLRGRLSAGGHALAGPADGHIVPLLVGDPGRTMQLSATLRRSGFLVAGVRPPTVPPGTSRLRVSLSAAHPPEQVEALAATLLAALPAPG